MDVNATVKKTRVPDEMKKLAGRPLSAFVAYSRKRRNSESEVVAKKLKKNKSRLTDILPTNLFSNSLDSAKLVSPTKPTVTNKKKKKKRPKHTLSNGNATISKAAFSKQAKKLAKAQNLAKAKGLIKNELLDNSLSVNDSNVSRADLIPSLEVPWIHTTSTESSPEIGPIQTTMPESTSELTPIRSKKIDRSPVKNITSPTIKKNKESNENLDTPPEEAIPKSLDNDPVEEGKSLFKWLIHPVSIENFFQTNWERAPLQIKRSKSNYYKLLMSTPMLDSILRSHHILYSKNIDVTSYSNGQRETHNPPGRAFPSVVWDYYSNGCSIRMLNPQTFVPKLHALNATLQEFFGCFVGANSYLTPPDSQGFAPHYDDIEAFILQIEGKKRWRLYKPPTEGEYLPRYSSKNFDPMEIGEPILDTIVNAGDMLYFPRGTIHQGETIDGTHSLHITLSVYQKNSWCDFLEKLLPQALKSAIATDSRYREGLPLDYLRNVGFSNSSKDTEARESFFEKTKDLMHRLIDHIDIDKVADQMAKENIHDFLPPVLAPREQECSIMKDGERMIEGGLIENRIEIEPDTRIRLLRSHCIRLVEDDDCMKIYYSTENSREYHEYEPQFLEVGKELAPAVEEIIRCYPNFLRVDDLPIVGDDNKVQVARDLWEKCIVVTDVPLPILD